MSTDWLVHIKRCFFFVSTDNGERSLCCPWLQLQTFEVLFLSLNSFKLQLYNSGCFQLIMLFFHSQHLKACLSWQPVHKCQIHEKFTHCAIHSGYFEQPSRQGTDLVVFILVISYIKCVWGYGHGWRNGILAYTFTLHQHLFSNFI